MVDVLDALRRASTPAVWSRGIELVRADAVLGERAGEDEVVLRVSLKGGMIARTVTLYPRDGDWECSCGAATGCEHAVAAAIAFKRARDEGKAMPAPRFEVGRIAYRLSRGPQGLALERGLVVRDRFQVIEATLAALAERRVDGPAFSASQADLAVELAMGTYRRGPIPRAMMAKLLAALAGCDEITLDGVPVRCGALPVLPRIVVTDRDGGFLVRLEEDPEVREVFTNGAVLHGEELRPAAEPPLTGRELHDLPRGLRFAAGDIAHLVTDILPSLAGRLPVDIKTRRLPGTVVVPPRIVVDARADGDALVVLAVLAYGDPIQARIDGGRLVHIAGAVPVRDATAEERLVRRLADDLGLAPGEARRFEGAAAAAFAARLEPWGAAVRGDRPDRFAMWPRVEARFEPRGDDFALAFECVEEARAGPTRRADPGAVLRAWREGASLVPLTGGGWAPLPHDWLSRYGERVLDLLAAREAAGGATPALLPDLARLCEDLDLPPPPGFARLEGVVESFDALPEAALPADLTAELRPYQRRGVDWLVFARDAGLGALLADDMGLGKTLQALCAVRGRTLVVAPTSVLVNWIEEIRRFRPGLAAALYHGARRKLDAAADVVVTSYAVLRLDEAVLAAETWDTVVLDEAQNIKNPESQAAQAAFRLRATFRVALSGTPVENRLDELWSQMHFVARGLLGGRSDFQERYARPIASGDVPAAARLRARIRPFVLRRLKSEVAPELPPRIETVLHCELDAAERAVYDAVRAAARDDVVRKLHEGGSVLLALEALLRLRQAACHTALVPGQNAATSSKVELLGETLETVVAEGHKALVFSQWTSLLDLVEPRLTARGIPFTRLDGSTVDRAGVVARFQDAAGPPVLLVSLKAGGTGLNLTAADHVFLLDPWWNPAAEDQAADRAHRIGQDRTVMFCRLVAEDTVEERILALQATKRALAGAALEGAGGAAELTRDDLLALLA